MNRIAGLPAPELRRAHRMAKAPVYLFATKLFKNSRRFGCRGEFDPGRAAEAGGLEQPSRRSVVPKVAFRSVQVHPGDCTIEYE
jgi:hypothetical protein